MPQPAVATRQALPTGPGSGTIARLEESQIEKLPDVATAGWGIRLPQ